MDVENLAKELILKNMTPEQQMAVLESVRSSVAQAKEVQKRKIGENVDLVVQALKKIESDIRSRFDDVGNAIEKRVSTIKDGRDGINGKDGRDGKDGRNGKDGAKGDRGERGQDGRDGVDGVDGVSVSNARIDFDGSLIITLSTGVELNVGEVVSPDLAESIKVITNGGGTSQYVLDTLASLQTQITNLIPSQTGNSGKFLTTNGTATSWASVAGGLSYQGTWNASTNTPTLTSSVGVNGYYYITDVAGSTNLNGITDWQIGDWLIFNGSVWQKIDQSNLVTSVNGQTGAVSVGTVTSVAATAGTGISITGSPITSSGTLTITNSAPDQTVSLTASTGISTSGTYPNFTITNTAPDQTVALTGAGTTSISGTYPNFTITSNDAYTGTVTSVTGTSPIASTGGATPAISLSAGYGDTLNPYASKTANYFLAAPNGSAGVPTFRAVVAADIPTLNQNTTGTASNVTGTVAFANGGTGATTRQDAMDALAGSVTSGSYLRGDGTDVVMSTIQAADVPTLNQNTTGSAATVTTTINSGVVATTQSAGDNSTKVATTAYVNAVTGTGGITGFKNRIINGDFKIAQRGTSFTSGSNSDDTYNLDRWYVLSDGNDIVDITQTTTVPTGAQNSIGLDVETINKKFGIAQIIEASNCYDAIGGNVTLSFQAKVTSTTKLDNVKCAIVAWSGTADTVTSDIISAWGAEGTNPTLIANATYENSPVNLNVTTSFASYSVTANVDTASTKNIILLIWSDVTDTTLGDFLYITNVQLEKGTTATSFDYRPYGTELALCQRYYELYDGANLFLSKIREATRDKRANFYYKVTKRASATVTIITSNADGGGAISATSGIDGGFFESLSTTDGQTPLVSKFSVSIEL